MSAGESINIADKSCHARRLRRRLHSPERLSLKCFPVAVAVLSLTFSQSIMASRRRPTGQTLTHAPHCVHARANFATGKVIVPPYVCAFNWLTRSGSVIAGQASKHSWQPIQACNCCPISFPVKEPMNVSTASPSEVRQVLPSLCSDPLAISSYMACFWGCGRDGAVKEIDWDMCQ